MLPYYLYDRFGLKLYFGIGLGDAAYASIYFLIFISFWVFMSFILLEVNYTIKNKLNFFKHIYTNKIVLFGILPFIIYLFMKLF